jgi:diguanylate cyclase (GGDEF)-like protein
MRRAATLRLCDPPPRGSGGGVMAMRAARIGGALGGMRHAIAPAGTPAALKSAPAQPKSPEMSFLVRSCPAARGRGVARSRLIGLLACLAGLAAGAQAALPHPVIGPVTAASAPGDASAVLAGATTPTAKLRAIELLRRSEPEQAGKALEALLAQLPAGAPERIHALEMLGTLRAWMRDPAGAERVAQRLDAIAQAASQPGRAIAAADLVRARVITQDSPAQHAEHLVDDALAHLPPDTPPLERVRFLEFASGVKEDAGKLDESVALQLQALALVDSAGELWRRAEVRTGLASSYISAGQYDRARTLNMEALALAQQSRDDLTLSDVMNTESFLRAQAKDDAGELAALRAAIDYAHRAHARRDEIFGLANIADYYLKHADYATALQISQRALALALEIHSETSEALARTNIGLALIALHRKDEGLKYVHQALAMAQRTDSTADIADTYKELGTYLERSGELKDAFAAYREHRHLADDAFHQDQQRAIVELQERFDNDRRSRDLALLNRQNRLKDEQLLQRQLVQRLWATGAVLALVSLGAVALLVRRGRRANRLLASTNERLKVQSECDPLTGLANRRHFQQAMRQLAADGRLAGTVFLLDIDHFKRINDVHGHAAGDAVLVEIARRLRAVLRESDLIVRWGGEEFLAVVRSLSPEQIDMLVRRLLDAVAAEPITLDHAQVHVSASIGFATLPLEPGGLSLSWEHAIELVDTTLYLAKAHGRNRAYGIRLLHAHNEAEALALARTLEQAWRDGRVALTLLSGPPLPSQEASAA